MNGERAYSGTQFFWAVNLAAALGWAAINLPLAGAAIFGPNPEMALWVLIVGAAVGLPIALAACWVAGAWIIWRLMARPITWRLAAKWGILIPLAMEIGVLVVLGVQYVTADGPRSADPPAWLPLAAGSVAFVLLGLAVALAARAIVGPGTPVPQETALAGPSP